MKENELSRLLEKYLEGTATPEEIHLVEAFFESYKNEARNEGYTNITGEHETLHREILDGLYKRYRRTHRRSKVFSTVWRAAAVILVLIVPAYLLYEKQGRDPVADPVAQDIAPGSDKAILILSDNTRIDLDSTRGSVIPAQGNAMITHGNGRLSYVDNGTSPAVHYNMIITPRGGQYQLVLADGSKVWLNAASALRYPTSFSGNERNVELNGEAYFEVAKDTDKPFIVAVGQAHVQVLGTHFNIMAHEDEDAMETTLLEGAVRVTMKNTARTLEPNQQARIAKDGSLTVLENYDVEEAVAWKDGTFIFNKTNIEVIMRQISRWYDVDVTIADDVPPLNFGGVVSRRDSVSSVIRLLELTGALEFEIGEGRILVKPAVKKPINLPD